MEQHTVVIERLTHGPYGLGHLDGKVILVPHTAPGDVVRVCIVEDRKRYAVGELIALLQPGSSRAETPCPYAGSCGGCSWQQVDYECQLASKQQNVADALARTAKLTDVRVLPILRGSPPYHYRRRIRLHAGPDGLGFRRLLSHEVVPVDRCLIAQPSVGERVPLAAEWAKGLRTRLDSVEIVWSQAERVIFVGKASGSFRQKDERLCQSVLETHPALAGIVLSGRNWRRHWGEDQIPYSIGEDTDLRIDADAFSQTNAQGNARLVQELMSWGEFDEQDHVLELYAGAGNLTLPIARRAGEVIAVEASQALVRNGKQNAHRHGLTNISWRCQSAESSVADCVRTHSTFAKVVLNPPRSGAKDVMGRLAELRAQKIFYLACDPATMARDVGLLSDLGYHLERVRPVDLFPQTHHVEVLAELSAIPERAVRSDDTDEI